MKIVNLDGITTNPGDQSWEWLGKYGEFVVYDRTEKNQIIERSKDADILIINKTYISEEILNELPKLKFVALQSTGFNAIDCDAAKKRNILVANIPAYSTNAVAQLVFGFILEFSSCVGIHNEAVHNGEWCACPDFCFWNQPLTELDGKTLGIIGFGSIGQMVAKIANAFDMNVIAYTPHPKQDEFKNVKFVELDTIFTVSDYITCHCPLNENTKGLINKDALDKMKESAILINTSRGPVVDDYALANALNSGKIKGAGLDVLTVEPPKQDNPLLSAKNCIITPHIAWAAYETRARLLAILEENIKAYVEGRPQNIVNN